MSESNSAAPLLSLVIATVGRVAELERCLESMAGSSPREIEVILVDQNPDDRLGIVVERASRLLRVVWLRQRRAHGGSARNFGARHAKGRWLGFPDDDCHVLPETFEQLRFRIATERFDVISGMTRDEHGAPSVLRWLTHEAPMTLANLRRCFAESTFYIRRELFLSVGGFDPGFGPGSPFAAEEGIDLMRRLWKADPMLRAIYSPAICFIHANASPYADEDALLKTRLYARARGASFARHWRTASVARIANELARHIAGCIVLRGLRRRSRYLTLLGYLEGFVQYRSMESGARQEHDGSAAARSLTMKG